MVCTWFLSRYAFIKYGNVTETMWHSVYILSNANRRQPNVTTDSLLTDFPIKALAKNMRIMANFICFFFSFCCAIYAFVITSYQGNFTRFFSFFLLECGLNAISWLNLSEGRLRFQPNHSTHKNQDENNFLFLFILAISRVLCDKCVARAVLISCISCLTKKKKIVPKWLKRSG